MAVEAAVSFAVETLGNFLIEKAVFLKGVEGDVEWLRNELKRMQCFQKDAARKQSKSESISNWISEIREVAHDAADTIEMFVLNVESRAQQQGRSDCCFQYPDRVCQLNRVGKEIESIRKRLRDIEDGRVRYGIQDDDHGRDAGTSIQVDSLRRLAYWQKDTDVVGLEEDVEELVEKLLRISKMEEEKNVEVARKREEEINRKREEMIRRRSEEWKLEEEEVKERKREDEEEERKRKEEEEEERKREEERKVEEEKRVEAARKKRKDEINMKREDRMRGRELDQERKSEEERKREKEEERKLEEEMEERKREEERKVLEEAKRVEAARKKRKDEINMKREDRLRRRKLEQERKREEERKMEEEERKREEEQRKREEERKGHSVASIEGMGGIGKSTLASRIYNHPAVADRFESRAWVVVSSDFMLEDIIKQIMHQLDIPLYDQKLLESMKDELRRQDILQEQLHEELKGKLYFVVLDDLWDALHFEALRRAFPQDKASRLILTSRSKGMRYSTDYVHEMKLLDDNRSWKLFLRKAFIANSGGKCPEELKDIGEEILTKCQGLPLAISVVGGLLLRKTPCRSEWLKVRDELKSQLDGNRSESESDIKTISTILELSYKHLLPELKACFLCLGFFKEDAMIKVKNLVHIWVAQGLVPQREVGVGETMEDVAREYLGELISRNMVQVKESTHDRVKACKMHDLIRDLCLRKAKEEIDFEVLSEEGNSHHSSSRHRAVYSTRLSVLNSTRNQHVRSLFIHGETERNISGDDWQSYWKSFELLRVLDLGNVRFQIWPKAIGGLVGLRYLKMIYDGKDSSLPRSWAKLKNLQVLDLGCGFGLFITDKVILEMDSLRHLYAYISSHSKVPLGNLRNLQTLCFFVVEDSNLWQVKEMTGVTKLGIDMRKISDARNIFMNLAELENLVNLTLLYHVSENLDGLDTLQRVTQLKLITMSLPRNFPPNLSHLTLSRMRLGEDPMPVLEKLPKLLYIKLCDNYIGEEMVVSHCGFPRLKVMALQDNVRVKNVMIEEGAMPELKQLMIHNCKRLIIDNLPEHLKSKIIVAD